MRRDRLRLAVGLILVAAGILFILQNFNLLISAWGALWALIFAAAGVAFLWAFFRNRESWWPVIPGLFLLAIAALIALDSVNLGLAEAWGGAIVLAGIGIAFAVVYIAHREHWWAIIPAGVLLTLALTTALYGSRSAPEAGSVFLMGLGVTLAVAYALALRRWRLNWMLILAAVLFLIGAVTLAASTPAGLYVWPLALIAIGLYILFRILRPRRVY